MIKYSPSLWWLDLNRAQKIQILESYIRWTLLPESWEAKLGAYIVFCGKYLPALNQFDVLELVMQKIDGVFYLPDDAQCVTCSGAVVVAKNIVADVTQWIQQPQEFVDSIDPLSGRMGE